MASIRCIARQEVLQEELEMVILIENQIRTLQKVYKERTGSLLLRLLGGGAVECGPHEAEVEKIQDGPSCTTRLMINGRPA